MIHSLLSEAEKFIRGIASDPATFGFARARKAEQWLVMLAEQRRIQSQQAGPTERPAVPDTLTVVPLMYAALCTSQDIHRAERKLVNVRGALDRAVILDQLDTLRARLIRERRAALKVAHALPKSVRSSVARR
jgi:hypothetical protein